MRQQRPATPPPKATRIAQSRRSAMRPWRHCCARISLAEGVGGRLGRRRGGVHLLDAESVVVERAAMRVVVIDWAGASAATVVVVDATGASAATFVVSTVGACAGDRLIHRRLIGSWCGRC